jgi:hypothetical protein
MNKAGIDYDGIVSTEARYDPVRVVFAVAVVERFQLPQFERLRWSSG